MNQDLAEQLATQATERLFGPHVKIEASGRHVHLSQAAVEALFGPGHQLRAKTALSQPGQFSCQERVTLRGPKGCLEHVAVLGPVRAECQAEVSATDALALGIHPPVRMSGDLAGSPGITLIGPQGELQLTHGLIIARRHLHLSPEAARHLELADGDEAEVTVCGARALCFRAVAVRVSPAFVPRLHIDYDEANACRFRPGMVGFVKKRKEDVHDLG